ncbi:hypothetical protein Bca52824_028859 [Brassica carinata]|uniref:Uncharacterized protein n=1 Tax=Brassica carinata TaxID=52824 RepID=A0A8X7VD81_BRACI|nr:hypothetical protein Bca52824_028859 [Brassica carinata]
MALVGVGARALFYPTLIYNVVRNKVEAEFHWLLFIALSIAWEVDNDDDASWLLIHIVPETKEMVLIEE